MEETEAKAMLQEKITHLTQGVLLRAELYVLACGAVFLEGGSVREVLLRGLRSDDEAERRQAWSVWTLAAEKAVAQGLTEERAR